MRQYQDKYYALCSHRIFNEIMNVVVLCVRTYTSKESFVKCAPFDDVRDVL